LKVHIKSCLTFLLITIILLVGLTAISAADVDNTQIQEIVKHTEVSTTSYEPVSKDVQAETVKTDNNLNEEEKTIEKVNNTKTNTNTITKSPTIQSSNAAVKTYDPTKAVYVSRNRNEINYDWTNQRVYPTYQLPGNSYGAGTRSDPTDLYTAINLLQQDGVIILLADDTAETVYETRPNAPWINFGGSYYPGKGIGQRNTLFTIMGEEDKTIVWSGLRENTNMFSLSEGFNATLMNIVFRNGNASGIDRTQAGAGPTATHG
jgi:hypothetical protein